MGLQYFLKGTLMADEINYSDDVARYASPVDDAAVAGIVKHLGIALRSNDGNLVSCSDKTELDRVRDSWCKKKLAVADDDATVEAAVAAVCATMKEDHNKQRVTFYYLLASHYGKLADLH
jgi:Protein of unknown function (DUF2853)